MSKSVKTMATIVITNGINCSHPFATISLKMEGLANLYPVIIKMAAREANGIRFKTGLRIKMLTNKNKP